MKNTAPERRILGIYYDKDHHPYFYHSKSRSAYFIPERDIKMAEVVAYRHWIAIAVGVVLYTLFQGTPLYAFAVRALLFVSLEWFYRQKMVKKYKKISPYIPHQNARSKAMSEQKSSLLLIKAIGYFTVAGLIAWTILDQNNTGPSLAVLVAMIGITVVSGIQNLVLLIKRR
jgi:hypothetical protein